MLALPALLMAETKTLQLADCIEANGNLSYKAATNGAIVGVPASVDLGTNKGYKLSVQSGSIRIVKKGLVLIVK